MATEIDAGDAEFERALSSVAPIAAAVDPVSAAYAAGVRSGRRAANRWRVFAGLAAVIAIGPWALRGQTQSPVASSVPPTVLARTPVVRPSPFELTVATDAWRWHAADISLGVDGIPKARRPAAPPVSLDDQY